jgi:hypothetical protein
LAASKGSSSAIRAVAFIMIEVDMDKWARSQLRPFALLR